MHLNPNIRRAAVTDLDAVNAIEQECFSAAGDAFTRRQLRYLIAQAQGVCLVAMHNGRIVGYIVLLSHKGARHLRIYSVAVAPLARSCGTGQALITAAIAEAQRRGLNALTLEVRADNIPAQQLYTKNGFKTEHLLRNYYHDGSDGLRMRLRLPRQEIR